MVISGSTALWLRICPTVPLICSPHLHLFCILDTPRCSLKFQLSFAHTDSHTHTLRHTLTHTLRHTHWLWSFCHVSSVEICNFCRHTHLSKVLRLRPLGCQSKCTSLDTWPRPSPLGHCTHSTVEQLTSFLIKYCILARMHTHTYTHTTARFTES